MYFVKRPFVKVGIVRHDQDALNMHIVFWKTVGREDEVAKEGRNFARSSSKHCSSTYVYICRGAGTSSTWKSEGAANCLKSAATRLISAQREVNSSRIECRSDHCGGEVGR